MKRAALSSEGARKTKRANGWCFRLKSEKASRKRQTTLTRLYSPGK
jgi:hypothetical protein